MYSRKGAMEICRWSRQPKADAFMDWVWDVTDSIIASKYKNLDTNAQIPSTILKSTNGLLKQYLPIFRDIANKQSDANFKYEQIITVFYAITKHYQDMEKGYKSLISNQTKIVYKHVRKAHEFIRGMDSTMKNKCV